MASSRPMRPYSLPEFPSRSPRPRIPIYSDVLFDQGPLPMFAKFSSRGSRAICCFRNGYARIWNVDPSHDRFLDCDQVLCHPETVYRAALSDDGTRAVTTAGDGFARVWELKSHPPASTEIGSQYRSTRSCDISPDGQFVAATFYTGKKLPVSMFRGLVLLYEPERKDYLFRINVHGIPDKVKVSRDANAIAVGCFGVRPAQHMARDNRIIIFSRHGTELIRFDDCFQNEDACNSWDLSDDGLVLAICGQRRQALEVYSDKLGRTWQEAPAVLAANADLTYEMCRIIDNGDLITAVALDNRTEKRSILVFRPCTRTVLFSLACGLSDPRACLDLEPRVCYVAPDYDQPAKKVVRFLSRDGAAGKSALGLVRCGGPPKNARHRSDTDLDSAAPKSSRDKSGIPPKTRDAEMHESDVPSPRLFKDSAPPRRSRQIPRSPTRGSSQTATAATRTHEDTLGKNNARSGNNDPLGPLRNHVGLSPSNPSTNSTGAQTGMKRRRCATEQDTRSVKEAPIPRPSIPNDCNQFYESNDTHTCPQSTLKNLQTIEKAEQPSEAVLYPTSKVAAPSRELMFAKSEALACKSTVASKTMSSKTMSCSTPEVTLLRNDTNSPSTREAQQEMGPKFPSDFNGNVTSDMQLYSTEYIIEGKNNDAVKLLHSTATNENLHGNITQAEKTTIVKSKKQNRDADVGVNGALVLNLNKPRWQPARVRVRKQTASEYKANNEDMAPSEQENMKDEDLIRSLQSKYERDSAPALPEQNEARSQISNPLKPLNPHRDGDKRGVRCEIPCDQHSQGFTVLLRTEPSTPLGPQSMRTVSSPRTPGSAGYGEVFSDPGDVGKECEGNDGDAMITVSNLLDVSYDRLVQTPESQARSIVNTDTIENHRPDRSESERMVKRPSYHRQLSFSEADKYKAASRVCDTSRRHTALKEESSNIPYAPTIMLNEECEGTPLVPGQETAGDPRAKQEMALDYPNAKSSPQAMTLQKSAQTSLNRCFAPEPKPEPNEAVCKSRYSECHERARNMFRLASQNVEGSLVLSNVKAFKTMLDVVGIENESIDRRIVAKIVYEKGGINNTLDEPLFLEAFSHLYKEMLCVRRQQWTEVYNHAITEDGEGLLVFHARDLIKRESRTLNAMLNAIWSDESLDEAIASQTGDGVLVDQAAFLRSTDKIFSV